MLNPALLSQINAAANRLLPGDPPYPQWEEFLEEVGHLFFKVGAEAYEMGTKGLRPSEKNPARQPFKS